MTRILDFIFSLFGILVLWPVGLIVYILGLFDTGSPIFKQKRVGKNQKPFTLLKFRTMGVNTKSVATHLASSSSVTKLGAFLRKSKLDELPQLINVLKGDMSLVGPRPLLVEYLPLYSEKQSRRHEVRPGITGWAQVNGRNAISWDEKFDLDVWYVDNQSIWLDIKILWMTVKKVINRDDISAKGEVTMPAFKGSKNE